ncbi:CPBP family intramembrane glutamic endopeptidase [Halobellus litoreus]|jgi:membrane protease YdiL (CAAX protease family)|uniref:CPBP family intramembrane glutamic endopeptidase n=1 Tax=Halobellus litoreus TaxID=755310 RepID=A0ABD6DUH9_9EURY|nr:CPBP family intramembrane glutamic endopeptidase [Halobellus litoreus]
MSRISTFARRYPIPAYAATAYTFSWVAWGLQYLQPDPMGPVGTLLFLIGGLGPLVAGVIVALLVGSFDGFRDRLFRWRVSPVWYVVSIGGPLVGLVTLVAIDSVLSDGQFRLTGLHPLTTLPGAILIGLVLGGLEEPGWRGFAQARLQKRHNALVASGIVAVMWVVWHLPLFVLPGTSQSEFSFVPFAVMGLTLAIIFAWLFNSAGGSVPVVVLAHGAFNGALGWSGLLETGNQSLAVLIVGLGLISVALVFVSGPSTLSTDPESRSEPSNPVR